MRKKRKKEKKKKRKKKKKKNDDEIKDTHSLQSQRREKMNSDC